MISIVEIASFVPEGRESNFGKKELFDLDDAFIRGKLGVHQVSRMPSDQETSDLCVAAFSALAKKHDITPDQIECVIVCTQNPDGRGLPHTSAVVQGKLGTPDACACFDISLGCSGYVYGLSICQSFMQANGLSTGLFFTADPYSKIVDPHDKNTVLLFGDAATVTLLQTGARAGTWTLKRCTFATRGDEGSCLRNVDGHLQMNGRAVFNFSAVQVPDQIRSLLAAQALEPADVDMYLFHQGSKYILDTLTKRLSLPPEKVPSNLAQQGNTVSSSIPLLFEPFVHDSALNRVMMSGFGVGLSWASCILERNT